MPARESRPGPDHIGPVAHLQLVAGWSVAGASEHLVFHCPLPELPGHPADALGDRRARRVVHRLEKQEDTALWRDRPDHRGADRGRATQLGHRDAPEVAVTI